MAQRLLLTFSLVLSLAGCTALVDKTVSDNKVECVRDADCPTVNPCDGTRSCDLTTHTCALNGDGPNCDDAEVCTEDSCDPTSGAAECVHAQVDADHDGYSPGTCSTAEYQAKQGDCDEANNAVNPGVSEVCGNTVDENCNGSTTDAPASRTCYDDTDGDGYPNKDPSATHVVTACDCPSGTVPKNDLVPVDCGDGLSTDVGALVHPVADGGANPWYTKPYCRKGNQAVPPTCSGSTCICDTSNGWYASFDYDCANGEQHLNDNVGSTCGGGIIFQPLVQQKAGSSIPIFCWNCSSAWDSNVSSYPPGCGVTRAQWTCNCNACNSTTTQNTQQCH